MRERLGGQLAASRGQIPLGGQVKKKKKKKLLISKVSAMRSNPEDTALTKRRS